MRQLSAILGIAAVMTTSAGAQTMTRREISRTDIAGTNKEMILVEVEIPPGATSPRHTHPGEEAFYVVQGSTVQFPGKPAEARDVGTGGINKREVPHAGYKVVGDKALRQVSVYVVDKGKPLSTPAQ